MAEPTEENPYDKYKNYKEPPVAGAVDDPDNPYAKYVPAKSSGPGLLESFGRGAIEGATFGYDDKLGMNKEAREASRQANPWTHFAGELAGGIAPMLAAAALPTGVGQAAAGARGANLLARGAGLVRSALVPGEIGTLGQATGQAVKVGGTYGALSGSGHADVDPTESLVESSLKRGMGAAKGAAEGAASGLVLGPLGYGVYRAGEGLGGLYSTATSETAPGRAGALNTFSRKLEEDRITPQQLMNTILQDEFPSPTQTADVPYGAPLSRRFYGDLTGNRQPVTPEHVEGIVRGAMNGQSPAEISRALQAANNGDGPGEAAVRTMLNEWENRYLGPLNLVDRAGMARTGSGENTQWSMRAAAATPGEHLGIAREGMLERQLGSNNRIGQLLDRVVGSSDYDGVAARHAANLEAASDAAYATARASETPFDLTDIVDRWAGQYGGRRGPIPEAIESAINSIRNREGELPSNLQDFIDARQNMLAEAMRRSPGVTKGQMVSGRSDAISPESARIMALRGQLSAEVRRTNPAWGAANDIFRDGMSATDAMEAGARMSTRLNGKARENLSEYTSAQQAARQATDELQTATRAILGPNTRRMPDANELAQATPAQQNAVVQANARLAAANSRQELFRVGLVRSISDRLANQGETHDLTRQLLLPGARDMLTQVLGDEAPQFLRTLRAEAAMQRTYKSQFGAQTTPLAEHVKDNTWAPRFEVNMMNPLTWLNPAMRTASEYWARNIANRRNTELMRMYTNTDPLEQLGILRDVQNVTAARTRAGNTLGQPVVGSTGTAADALPGKEYGETYGERQPIPPYRP